MLREKWGTRRTIDYKGGIDLVTDADRVENIRRVAETSKLMVDAGLIVLQVALTDAPWVRALEQTISWVAWVARNSVPCCRWQKAKPHGAHGAE